MTILVGDCREVMATLDEASVDAIVCDPPYGLVEPRSGSCGVGDRWEPRSEEAKAARRGGFMGKKWDAETPGIDYWLPAFRVLKPGGHLLAFSGTRTSHRMVCAIEDAGFEIRDSICWLYGQGFPKSHNLPGGLGTALKPSHEPICVARKPIQGTVAANVLAHGTGALNIASCRISPQGDQPHASHGDTRDAWLGIPPFDGTDADALRSLPDALQRISAGLRSGNTDGIDHAHDADDQGGTSPSGVQYAGIRFRLYPNGSWCGLRLSGALDFRCDCPTCPRFDDARLHAVQEAAQGGAPSLADALDDIHRGLSELARTHVNPETGHPSNCGAVLRIAALAHLLTYYTTPDVERAHARRDPNARANKAGPPDRTTNGYGGYGTPEREWNSAQGRWPANVALSHHADCTPVGTRRVKSGVHIGRNIAGTEKNQHGRYNGGMPELGTNRGYADADGMETVEAWDCHPDCPVRLLDEMSGERAPGAFPKGKIRRAGVGNVPFGSDSYNDERRTMDGGSGASRFFLTVPLDDPEDEVTRLGYFPKASRRERNAGLEGMPERGHEGNDFANICLKHHQRLHICGCPPHAPRANHHPTVKPIALMRWLVRLVTPPVTPDGKRGVVLDPFCGSGSTGAACALEGFDFIGIEQDAEYAAIAERRIAFWRENGDKPAPRARASDHHIYGGGKGRRMISRCPEHGLAHDTSTRDRFYKCGCRTVNTDYSKPVPSTRPTILQHALPLEGAAD